MRLVREDGGKTLHSIRIVHTSRSTFEVGQVIVAATVLGGDARLRLPAFPAFPLGGGGVEDLLVHAATVGDDHAIVVHADAPVPPPKATRHRSCPTERTG